MQEQINDKTVALSTKAARMTAQTLERMIRIYLQNRKGAKNKKHTKEPKHGKQSLNSLQKHGVSLSNVEISGDNIGSFNKIARKYNLDFTLKKDDSNSPPRWYVFFKAKDDKALEAAFKEYSKLELPLKAKKPTILERIVQLKKIIKTKSAPVKNKNHGGHEL